ncbi:MAG: orotate phosphoribosyltransferase [bacterium]
MKSVAKQVAQALVSINGVGFVPNNPITFKSGILSPMYLDNRKFPSFPREWRVVLDGFSQMIEKNNIQFDMIAGIETAGIPHSAGLAVVLSKPSVFVRKQAKDHGTKKMVEGGEVSGKKVLLIEDLVTTGGSSLAGVRELRAAGAIVTDCLVIVSYGLAEANLAFAKESVNLVALTDVNNVVEAAAEAGKLDESGKKVVLEWLQNPREWKG